MQMQSSQGLDMSQSLQECLPPCICIWPKCSRVIACAMWTFTNECKGF